MMAGQSMTIGIVGTGDYGRALGTRLLRNGYTVVYGSRDPKRRNLARIEEILAEAQVLTLSDCIQTADVIFLAMHADAYDSLKKYESVLSEKIVVDVSNPKKISKDDSSNAEALQSLLPQSYVVKGFNTISTYALETEVAGQSKVVYVCGNEAKARAVVIQLAREMGFLAMDRGGLKSARALEEIPLQLMNGWGAPSIVFLVSFILWTFYAFLRYYVLRETPYTWERFPTNFMNKVFACVSITLLALCFMAGSIAAFSQIIHGTKHRRFSKFLDGWLKMRKQLGLFALLCAIIHTVMSIALLSPAYYSKWYLSDSSVVPANHTDDVTIKVSYRMNWRGETCTCLGLMAVAVMTFMGLCSLPSVGERLNWREWTFFQSHMGYVCLTIAVSHVLVKGAPDWVGDSFVNIIQSMAFVSQVIPWVTMLMKIILLMPCIYIYLWRIRGGYERGVKYDIESGSTTPLGTPSPSSTNLYQMNGHANIAFENTGL